MPAIAKFLIGLRRRARSPAGSATARSGAARLFVAGLEAQADAVLRDAAVPGVSVALPPRSADTAQAVLSGPANDFQRDGMGRLPGLNDRVARRARRLRDTLGRHDCCARR